jgi:hypothetical protein
MGFDKKDDLEALISLIENELNVPHDKVVSLVESEAFQKLTLQHTRRSSSSSSKEPQAEER